MINNERHNFHEIEVDFDNVMSSIAKSRRHYSGLEIIIFFKPITNKYKLSVFRDFLASRYNITRSEKYIAPDGNSTQNAEGLTFEGDELRHFSTRFSRDDILVVYFTYTDDWVNIISFGAYLVNKDMIGGRVGGILLLPLAAIYLAFKKVKRFIRCIAE